MRLEDRMRIEDEFRRARPEGHDVLSPIGQRDHVGTVQMRHRQRERGQAQDELHIEQDQDEVVGAAARGPDAGVKQAAKQQHAEANKAYQAKNAARDDSDQLLRRGGDAHGLIRVNGIDPKVVLF